MAVGDLYRVALKYILDGQENVNVMHFEQMDSTGGNEGSSEAAVALTQPLATVWDKFVGRATWNHVYSTEVVKVDRLISDIGNFSVQNPIDGPNSARLPTVVAATVTLRTGFQGPSRRGRIFMGGVPADGVIAGQLSGQGITWASDFITAFGAAFMGGSPTSKFRIGVFSRKRYEIISNPFDDYFKPVTTATFQPTVGTMHSRKVGLGS
jgi:hypothetical protein